MAASPVATKSHNLGIAKQFLTFFSHYVRIDISCKQIIEEDPHELVQWMHEELVSFCKHVTNTTTTDMTLWPSLYTVSLADATTAKEACQDRGCFLIATTDNDQLKGVLKEWEQSIRQKELFKDYYPVPLLSTHLVRQDELGLLRVDEWMCPEAIKSPPLAFNQLSPEGEESYAFIVGKEIVGSLLPSPVPQLTPTKLNPALTIINRLKWDLGFNITDYTIVYEDRHAGLMEISVELWTTETTEDHFIPMHRVRSIKRKSTGQTVWHREERVDLISNTTL